MLAVVTVRSRAGAVLSVIVSVTLGASSFLSIATARTPTGATIVNSITPTCHGKYATVFVRSGMIIGGTKHGERFISELPGSTGDDVIIATNASTIIHGNGGTDFICAFGGNDSINTTDGNGWVSAGEGNNTLILGDGSNMIKTGNGNDRIAVGDGWNDIDAGDGKNEIRTGDGNNTILTGGSDDVIHTGGGDNKIEMGGGNDALDLGGGFNTVDAGEGTDLCRGGGSKEFKNCEPEMIASGSPSTASAVAASAAKTALESNNPTGKEGGPSTAIALRQPILPTGLPHAGSTRKPMLRDGDGYRGHQTMHLAAALKASMRRDNGKTMRSATQTVVAAGSFGGGGEAGLSPEQKKAACSAQMLLGEGDTDGRDVWTAKWLEKQYGWPRETMLSAMRDPSLCTDSIAQRYQGQLVAIADESIAQEEPGHIYIAPDGIPYSLINPVYNVCIRNSIIHDRKGVALNCERYHKEYKWIYPEHPTLEFIYNYRLSSLLSVPDGYELMPVPALPQRTENQ